MNQGLSKSDAPDANKCSSADTARVLVVLVRIIVM